MPGLFELIFKLLIGFHHIFFAYLPKIKDKLFLIYFIILLVIIQPISDTLAAFNLQFSTFNILGWGKFDEVKIALMVLFNLVSHGVSSLGNTI